MALLILLISLGRFIVAVQCLSSSPPPLPPWTFSDAKIMYQPALVPLEAAREVTTPRDGEGLTILSIFGWTLGGIFAVEWADSPVGYYRETAVLSALVCRDFGIGAWANHIVVTQEGAAAAARELFGLPAIVGTVEVTNKATQAATSDADRSLQSHPGFQMRRIIEELAVALKCAFGTALPGISDPSERLKPQLATFKSNPRRFIFEDTDSVTVEGWDGWMDDGDSDDRDAGGIRFQFSLNLPSFSGKLLSDDGTRTGLLKYDLTIGPARNVRLRTPMATSVLFGNGREPKDEASRKLANVLGGPVGFIPCLQVDGVTVVAGKPEKIGSGRGSTL